MIAGGEEPEFIARRMAILASEDIGLANPNALLLANATFDMIHKIGWPEGRIALSECAIYLANSAKSNTAYKAINAALDFVDTTGNLPVPLHLRNAPTKLMKQLDYGKIICMRMIIRATLSGNSSFLTVFKVRASGIRGIMLQKLR